MHELRKIFEEKTMKKAIFILLFLCAGTASGQNRPENALLLLNGGHTRVEASFFWQLLAAEGIGLRYKSAGNWDVWGNPASLISFREAYLSFGLQPGLKLDPGRYVDIPAEIRSQVDQNIADYRVPETELTYPDVGIRVGQRGGLFGLQLAYPLRWQEKPLAVSLDISQPFFLNLTAQNDGLNLMLEATRNVSGQKKIIHMRVNAILQALLNMRMTGVTLGIAREFNEKLAAGLRFGRDYSRATLNAQANVDGIMETAGTEYVFNDPTDPHIDFAAGETNRLDQRAWLDFSGRGWHFNLGMLYRAGDRWTFGLDLRRASALKLAGKMNVVQYKIPALNVDALLSNKEDVSLLDAAKLNLAKLTLTEPVSNKTSDHMRLNRPSSLGVQASYQSGGLELLFSLRKYSGRFGYDFLGEERYVQPGLDLGLGISLGPFSFSLGGLHSEIVTHRADGTRSSLKTWIPHGNLRLSSFLLKRYHLDSVLFFSPTPGLGVRLGVFL